MMTFDGFFSISLVTDVMDNKKGSNREKQWEKLLTDQFPKCVQRDQKGNLQMELLNMASINYIFSTVQNNIFEIKRSLHHVSLVSYRAGRICVLLLLYLISSWLVTSNFVTHTMHILTIKTSANAPNKIQFNSWQASNSHVFWHLGTILMDSSSTKKYKSNTLY